MEYNLHSIEDEVSTWRTVPCLRHRIQVFNFNPLLNSDLKFFISYGYSTLRSFISYIK